LLPSFLTFFEQPPPERKWGIEEARKNLLMYRRGKAVNAPNMKPFLDQTSMIASTFFSAWAEETVRIESVAVAKRVPPLD
jgi:hypothetical protein